MKSNSFQDILDSINSVDNVISESTTNRMMTLDEAISEWESKPRKMGCVAATDWLCKRVPRFRPERLRRWMKDGNEKMAIFLNMWLPLTERLE